MSSFGRSWPFAAVLVAMGFVCGGGAVGCELIAAVDRKLIPDGGGGGGVGGGGVAPECAGPSNCPDPNNPCLDRACTAGKCGTTPVADGTPLAMQTAGDCKSVQCDGKGGQKTVNDDTDVHNDGMACTDDLCAAGVPSNPPTTAGAMCGNNLICNGKGDCVGCAMASDCPGMETDCKARACDAMGVCGFTFTAAGTATSTQKTGDCQENRCDGAGNVMAAPDANDLPVDNNACTDDVCTAGMPSNPATMAGVSCSQMGGTVCDGNKACVECITASTCPGQDTECAKRTCTAGKCGVGNVSVGTPVAMQTPGDCKESQCDGNGGVMVAIKDTDLPDDSNPCTNDICTAGVPSHTNAMAGTACGMSLVCDANGTCVGCNGPNDCPGLDTECQTRTCVNNSCGFTFTMAGTPVAMQTLGDCKVIQCNGAGGVVLATDNTDLPIDGNTCTDDVCSMGVPSNPPVVSGTMCNQMGGKLCNGAGVCVACLLAPDCPGQDTDCQARTCTMGACGVANTMSGVPTSMQTAGDCKENQCDGNGGVMSANKDTDLPVDNNECTDNLCMSGVPSNPPSASGTMCNQMGGAVCDGNSSCVECVAGAMCPSGVCTGFVCQAPTCTDNVKNGDETDVDCGGSCATKCALGKICLISGDCAGDICTGGVCSQINGCDATNTTDLTGMAGTSIAFGGVNGRKYVPKCIKVTAGTVVTFNGSFLGHPLKAGELVGNMVVPAAPGTTPLPTDPLGLNMGSTAMFTMQPTGTYPYYCTAHVLTDLMTGVIWVVP